MNNKPKNTDDQLSHAMNFHGVDTVIDVGANKGQYALKLRRNGFTGPIYSIEPLKDIHSELSMASDDDDAWFVQPSMAVGDFDGIIEFERSRESDMSSVLPQSDLQKSISPTSEVAEVVMVPVKRLDGIIERLDLTSENLFVKLDVQGFEPRVLDGMTGLWPRVAGLQIEMSLVELYQGELPWMEMIAKLEQRGYMLSLLIPGYYERKLGRQLQVDGVFFRPPRK